MNAIILNILLILLIRGSPIILFYSIILYQNTYDVICAFLIQKLE